MKTGSCDRCSKGPHYWFFSRFCSFFQTKIIFPSPNLIGNQRTTALSIYFVHKISTTTTAIFIFLIFNYLKFVKLYWYNLRHESDSNESTIFFFISKSRQVQYLTCLITNNSSRLHFAFLSSYSRSLLVLWTVRFQITSPTEMQFLKNR